MRFSISNVCWLVLILLVRVPLLSRGADDEAKRLEALKKEQTRLLEQKERIEQEMRRSGATRDLQNRLWETKMELKDVQGEIENLELHLRYRSVVNEKLNSGKSMSQGNKESTNQVGHSLPKPPREVLEIIKFKQTQR